MAICLEYQAVFVRRRAEGLPSWRAWGLALVLLLVVIGAEMRTRLEMITLGYELGGAQRMALDLAQQKRDLEFQLSVLTTHDNIRLEGERRLGLKEMSSDQIQRGAAERDLSEGNFMASDSTDRVVADRGVTE